MKDTDSADPFASLKDSDATSPAASSKVKDPDGYVDPLKDVGLPVVTLQPAEKKSAYTGKVGLLVESGRYRVGKAERPHIPADNGHLDQERVHSPTILDETAYYGAVAVERIGEAACSGIKAKHMPFCSGEDQTDALAAYNHFLEGNGATRTIDYERYLDQDPSGREALVIIFRDFRENVERLAHNRTKFSVTSKVYSVGNLGDLPHPETANWTRTLGSHYVWVSADVTVSVGRDLKLAYSADITIHAQDRYNFNPGQQDRRTGIPDGWNGMLEVSGKGHQYDNVGTAKRHISWKRDESSPMHLDGPPVIPSKKPMDSHRLRNKRNVERM
jgi:hypothetical protein